MAGGILMFHTGGSTAIIFLGKQKLQYYTDGGGVIVLDIPPTASRDLEIVNKNALQTILKTFLQQQKIVPGPVILVLSSDMYFEKDFLPTPEGQPDVAEQQYLDAIPFETTQTRLIPLKKGHKVIVINKEYNDRLAIVLEHLGFKILSLVPVYTLGAMSIKKWLDVDMGKYILKNIQSLISQNLLSPSEKSLEESADSSSQLITKKQRPLVLVGAFVALLVVLVLVLIFQR